MKTKKILLEDFELGRIVREVFPDIKRVQKRVKGRPTWHYNLVEIPISRDLDAGSSPVVCDKIEWLDLPNKITQFNWQLTSISDEFYKWIKLDTQALCDGVHVLSEVKIFKSWNFTVHVHNKEINKEDLGIYDLMASWRLISRLFNLLNMSTLCKGYLVPLKKTTKDLRGEITGRTEEWRSRESGTVEFNHHSINCRIIQPSDFKSSTRIYCDNCAKLKKNSQGFSQEVRKAASRKRESYMTEAELKTKLQEEKNKRRNAERREKYLREKINKEMKTFDLEDHKDFTNMFRMVEAGKLNPEMKLFWEEKEKAMLSKGPKGYRWHPKYDKLKIYHETVHVL